MVDNATDTAPSGKITLSESAVRRIHQLTCEGEYEGMLLRIAVAGGGCSGFQYGFSFDGDRNDDDRLVERDGARLLVDEVSWDYLAGSEIHFAEELIGSYFTVRNPNAASTCGCGISFAVG